MDRLDNIEELIRIIEAALLDIRLQLKMIKNEEAESIRILEAKTDVMLEIAKSNEIYNIREEGLE